MAKKASTAAKSAKGTVAGAQRDVGPKFPITLLDQVIGQARAKDTLQGALLSERIHHAWIFHGPTGVGKFTAAVAFAAALLDPTTIASPQEQARASLSPDPASQTQRLVRAGNHPDLHIISKELAEVSRKANVRTGKQTSLAKDVIDEFLIEPSARSRVVASGSNVGKVFIVDGADEMYGPAQNSLLKTLEEPPAGTVIILVTAAEDQLLPTIRSRSQRIAFHPLSVPEMDHWLNRELERRAATAPGESTPESADIPTEMPPRVRSWLLKFAGGSPGLARVALENELYAWHEQLTPKLEEASAGRFAPLLGAELTKYVGEQAERVVKLNPDASKDAANKLWARRLLAFIAAHFHTLLRQRTQMAGADGQKLLADPLTARALHAIDAISDAEDQLTSNVAMAFVFENLAAQLAGEPAAV